jgi:hypothetical protein
VVNVDVLSMLANRAGGDDKDIDAATRVLDFGKLKVLFTCSLFPFFWLIVLPLPWTDAIGICGVARGRVKDRRAM